MGSAPERVRRKGAVSTLTNMPSLPPHTESPGRVIHASGRRLVRHSWGQKERWKEEEEERRRKGRKDEEEGVRKTVGILVL